MCSKLEKDRLLNRKPNEWTRKKSKLARKIFLKDKMFSLSRIKFQACWLSVRLSCNISHRKSCMWLVHTWTDLNACGHVFVQPHTSCDQTYNCFYSLILVEGWSIILKCHTFFWSPVLNVVRCQYKWSPPLRSWTVEFFTCCMLFFFNLWSKWLYVWSCKASVIYGLFLTSFIICLLSLSFSFFLELIALYWLFRLV